MMTPLKQGLYYCNEINLMDYVAFLATGLSLLHCIVMVPTPCPMAENIYTAVYMSVLETSMMTTHFNFNCLYSRTSMARTLMSRLPRLFRFELVSESLGKTIP